VILTQTERNLNRTQTGTKFEWPELYTTQINPIQTQTEWPVYQV